MRKEKFLPSAKSKLENENKYSNSKILPSSDSDKSSFKSIPSSNINVVLPEPEFEKVLQKQETLEDRIHKSTISGGLKEVPYNFNERNGDWKVFFSENYFKVLYLDYKEYKNISKNIIESNYQLLLKFYKEKYSLYKTGSGTIPIQLEQKYGLEFFKVGFDILKITYETLIKPGGIENYYNYIEKNRFENGRIIIVPLLETVATIKILDPSTEKMIRDKGMEADLSENEINSVIEEFIKDKRIVRGEYSDPLEEDERLFIHYIKKLLKDKFLSEEEEKELKEDLSIYKISIDRYEELILQALREIGNCERESTLNKDKEAFLTFYKSILSNYGLDEKEELDSQAEKKLFNRDSSPTEFFPLKQTTRNDLINKTTEDYKSKLIEQKKYFITEALKNLQTKSKYNSEKELLLNNTKYVLLLPKHKDEIVKKVKSIIEYLNELYFIEIGRILYRSKCWKMEVNDTKVLIDNPELLLTKNSQAIDYRILVDENLLTSESDINDKTDLIEFYNIISGEEKKLRKR